LPTVGFKGANRMDLHLLIVDADEAHRHTLSTHLHDDGYDVSAADNAGAALDLIDRHWPQLALADLRFPGGSAEQLAAEINRQGDLPFIVISSNPDAAARVRALERFAEDYIVRPYHYPELLARIRRVLRRTLIAGSIGDGRIDLGPGRWVDLARRELGSGAQVRHLTPTEARLLELFVLNPGRVLPNDLILQRVWQDAPVGVNTLWEFIRRLRSKLDDDSATPRYILCARGVGYQFRRPE
jgi:DNA-binding response OmpR family regulator